MPRVTPSQVVDFLHQSFPDLRTAGRVGTLDAGSYQVLATLVTMLDALEEDFFGGLPGESYRDLIVALAYVRASVNRWQYPPAPGHGTHSVGPFIPLGNRHPVVVIRDVLRNCPEEPVAVFQARLGFLANPDLELSIATDVASAENAMSDGRYKNACVMAGAAIEALLLWAVQRRQPADHAAAFLRAQTRRRNAGQAEIQPLENDPRRWGLEQYIEVSRELPVLSANAADASLLAKDFRNLIHPGLAERRRVSATRGSAAQGIAALVLTIEDLGNRIAQGLL